jgi:hypothetical protein
MFFRYMVRTPQMGKGYRNLRFIGHVNTSTKVAKYFLSSVSRPALGPTQPPIQWVPGPLSLGVKWPGREADNSPSSFAEDLPASIFRL